MARTKNILIFCVMLLTIIIAGCSKEKKENETSAKAKDSYTIKHAMGETTVNGTPKELLF